MSKQTAVEWLIKIYLQKSRIENFDIDQAIAMDKEQRFQDFKEGFQAAVDSLQGANNLVQSKTYKGGEQ